MTLAAYVSGIGVLGPGLDDWPRACAVLAGHSVYAPARTLLPVPVLLPPTERRRTGRLVKLALGIASEAAARAGIDPKDLKSVFASSGGDGPNCHQMCEALTLEPREVSPTRFTNSVHNAAAGYWSIATGAKLESTVLCAFDASFCAGLLEAMSQVAVDRAPVLLAAYDAEYPEPLNARRTLPDAFGTALVLTADRTPGSIARIEAALGSLPAEPLENAPLEALRRTIPAARSLPLLERLAGQKRSGTVLEYLDVASLRVEVDPCS